MSQASVTMDYLKACKAAKAAGYPVSYTTDPTWLLHVAINRRAGWPDDPSCSRGSAMPLPDGRYPPKGGGDAYRHLELIAREINTPRLRVHPGRLGEWRKFLTARLPNRFVGADD